WYKPLARNADDLYHAYWRSLDVECSRPEGEGLHGLSPSAGSRHARRIHLTRSLSLLHLLGSHADPDVLHHRHLGREEQDLRSSQVLHLYNGRLPPDACCYNCSVLQGYEHGGYRFQPSQLLRVESRPGNTDLDVSCLCACFCHQSPDVSAPYMVA